MITIPPALKRGDAIGIVAPAGFMPLDKMQTCIATLEDWGYTVILGATTQSNSENYFSGTDAERLHDLQQMLDNKDIKAILCARGGYGLSRIIDAIHFKTFVSQPKWLIGFSDITVLHSHLFSVYKIASLHAPMAAAFNNGEYNNPFIQSLKAALDGTLADYKCKPHDLNRNGKASGRLVGGNLTLLTHLIGTRSDMALKGKILFLEDVGEYLYNIDRMLLQLNRSGKLKKLAGLVIGGFTDVKDTERPFGKTVYEIIASHVKSYAYPVGFNFPVSHGKENYALKVGVTYKLNVSGSGTILKEKQERNS
ncbi:MAG TPA: LD-carboxypeptidase [Chitinophagaceae bacterium]|nr:LD-carboxypeptidase [Chitinophagaceae bacterium]